MQALRELPGNRVIAGSSESDRLKLHGVRAVFRLINDIRERGSDPEKWRPHMVRRLRRLMGATIVVSSEVHFRRPSSTDIAAPADITGAGAGAARGGVLRVVDVGWVSDPHGGVSRIHTERDASPDAFWLTAGRSAAAGGPPAPRSVGGLVPVKPARDVYGGTAFILSQVALPHAGAVDQLGLHREWGDRPFTPAEHRLVRLFHLELARLWRRDVLRRAGEPGSELPPRLAQTLDALRRGASEKQIAAGLELSPHTVHNYVKALYRRFRVRSRSQLLAEAPPARPEPEPRLTFFARPVAGPRRGRK